MKDPQRSYSTKEVASRLGISPQTVQRWVDSGRLKAWKTPGGHRRIDAQSAELVFAEQEQATDEADALAGKAAATLNVVVVDDDPIDRDLLVTLAQAALPHARLFVASNGFQGLVLIAKWAPDIVVTDIHMPHMDGFEMIRNILADSATRPKLMIAVSAKTAKELRDFGQLPAEVVLLHKPLEPKAFMQVLQRGG